jgi:hypothetical protein
MKFSLRLENPGEDDLFSPLRELRSPISMETIKTLVFHHAAGTFSLWNYLWSVTAGVFAVGAVAGVLYHFSGNEPATERRIVRASIGSEQTFSSPRVEESHSEVPGEISYNRRDIPQAPASGNMEARVLENISPVDARWSHIENLGMKGADAPIENPIQPYSFTTPASPSWFATASSGAVFSHLRILGEAAEIGMNTGWESIGIAVTNASGNRDWHDVLAHHSSTSSLLFSESDQTVALLLGANYSIGPVAMKGELGPAYIISSSKFIDPVTEAFGQSSVTNKIGMAAEVSAFYHVSDFFQAGVTNISSYRIGQFTGSILISVNLTP